MKRSVRLVVLVAIAGLGLLASLAYWQLERRSVVVSTTLFREAADGWGLNPDQFVAVGRRTLPNQPATRVWERQGTFDVEEIRVTEAENLVCRARRVQGSSAWEHLGCRQAHHALRVRSD